MTRTQVRVLAWQRKEEGEKARNPAEQGMVKFANSLSMEIGENEDYVQNDLFYPRPGTWHAVRRGWVNALFNINLVVLQDKRPGLFSESDMRNGRKL